MKILICPDKYKGSADAKAVAQAIEQGVKDALSDAECLTLPVADGGEGSVSVLCEALGASEVCVDVRGPYGEAVRAKYAMRGTDAYIEMAEASGLCLTERREPMYASTYGTGEMMADAVKRGARTLTVFIGGSATCDGGMGMAAALGYRFYDSEGVLLGHSGENMARVDRIVPPGEDPLDGVQVYCACDVTNPTYGERGAAYVFAPQKGAGEDDVRELDRGLRVMADAIEKCLGIDVHNLSGGGAAGGLGAGLYAFAHAEMRGGFTLISGILSLEERIATAEVVITGEGCTDRQSMMGKVVGNISELCAKYNKKCVVISGLVKDENALIDAGICGSYSSGEYAPSLHDSMKDAVRYIRLAARDAAVDISNQ